MAPELTAPLKSANGSRASRRGKTKTFPKKERQGRACSASRWSAIGGRERAEERFYLTRSGPLMEAATAGSGCFKRFPPAPPTRPRRRQGSLLAYTRIIDWPDRHVSRLGVQTCERTTRFVA